MTRPVASADPIAPRRPSSTGLTLCLLLPCILGAEWAFILLLITGSCLLGTNKQSSLRPLWHLVMPLAVLTLLGLHGLARNAGYDVVKDVWYVAKIVVLMSVGYLLASRHGDRLVLFRAAAMAGAFAATWHFVQILLAYVPGMTLLEIRVEAGINSYLVTAVALAILTGLPSDDRQRLFRNETRWMLIGICAVSMWMAMSRTYWISFVILLIFFHIRSASQFWKLLVVAVMLGLIAMSLTGPTDDEVLETANASLVEKLVNSVAEVAVREYEDLGDINSRWRGYESFRAVVTFLDYPWALQWAGGGFGALVDLGLPMVLNGVEFESIPTLHNGYLYVLVKFGFVGALLFLQFLLRLASRPKTRAPAEPSFAVRRALLGLVVVTLAGTFVVTGIFNKDLFDSVLILMGGLFALQGIERLGNSQKRNPSEPPVQIDQRPRLFASGTRVFEST